MLNEKQIMKILKSVRRLYFASPLDIKLRLTMTLTIESVIVTLWRA